MNLKLKTRRAFLLTYVLRAPFWTVYNLLLFILYKDLHATGFQIALFIALKPIVSIFSLYWGNWVHGRPDRLVANIVWAGIIGYTPFLLFPIFYSSWYVIFASALFMTMHRGVTPAWMELFKRNLKGGYKHKVFSHGASLSYIICCVLPIFLGPLCDYYPHAWRIIFSITALLGIAALFFQCKIDVAVDPRQDNERVTEKVHLLNPWKNALKVFKENLDFRAYQIGFMFLAGSGLMIMQPALPKFFIDRLALSYTELAIAIGLCKGIGFALTSSIWARLLHKGSTFRISSYVTFLGALFPCALIAAQWGVYWIYIAYLLYGIMQAGSELIWHLSGPLFSREQDSVGFSNINLLVVGVRGMAIPQLGAFCCLLFPPIYVLGIGAILCALGGRWLLGSKQMQPISA